MNLSPNRGLRFSLLPPSTSLRSFTILLQSFTIKHSSLLEILNALKCIIGYLGRKLTIDIRPLVPIYLLGNVVENKNFLRFHQDQSMRSSSNEREDLHTLVDRERKRSRERG